MKNAFFITLFLSGILSYSANSQTVVMSLPTFSALPGTQIQIPVIATGFDTVCNVSLVFNYDTNVLEYMGCDYNYNFFSYMTANAYKNQIRYGWYSLMFVSIPDNDWIIRPRFTYLGGTTTLNWNTMPGSCVIGNCQIGAKPSNWVNGNIGEIPHGIISGTLVYDNNNQSPMSQVPIILKNSSGIALDTNVTDLQGHYIFYVPNNGTYSLSLSPPQPWGGVNSIDALKVIHHFVGTDPLIGLALTAADVNHNNYVNTSDALTILKRFVGLQNGFPSGDWTYDIPNINLENLGQITINIKALCMGDVDRSYVP